MELVIFDNWNMPCPKCKKVDEWFHLYGQWVTLCCFEEGPVTVMEWIMDRMYHQGKVTVPFPFPNLEEER
jgi:hypothetical protein